MSDWPMMTFERNSDLVTDQCAHTKSKSHLQLAEIFANFLAMS